MDADRCIGAAQCTFVAPEVFDLGADGTSEVLSTADVLRHRDAVRSAAHQCPSGAISVEDAGQEV